MGGQIENARSGLPSQHTACTQSSLTLTHLHWGWLAEGPGPSRARNIACWNGDQRGWSRDVPDPQSVYPEAHDLGWNPTLCSLGPDPAHSPRSLGNGGLPESIRGGQVGCASCPALLPSPSRLQPGKVRLLGSRVLKRLTGCGILETTYSFSTSVSSFVKPRWQEYLPPRIVKGWNWRSLGLSAEQYLHTHARHQYWFIFNSLSLCWAFSICPAAYKGQRTESLDYVPRA